MFFLNRENVKLGDKEMLSLSLIGLYIMFSLMFDPIVMKVTSLREYLASFFIRLPFVLLPIIYFVSSRRMPQTFWDVEIPIKGFYAFLVVEPFCLWRFSLVNGYVGLRFLAWILMVSTYLAIIPLSTWLIIHKLKIRVSRSFRVVLGFTYIFFAAMVTVFNLKATWLLNLALNPKQAIIWISISTLYLFSAPSILSGIFASKTKKYLATKTKAINK